MPRIATLDSLKKSDARSMRGGEEDDDEDQGGNEYFTGGHGSGLAVLAPNTGGNDAMRSVVDGIQRQQQRQQQQGGGVPAPGSDGRRIASITLYANGFTLNDGPLRGLSEPANRQFLDSLQQGYCPPELVENGKPADVQIMDKSQEEYKQAVAAAPRFQAFEGTGTTLGDAGGSSALEGVLVPGTTDGTDAAISVNATAPGAVRVQIKRQAKKEVLVFERQHTVRHLIGRVELSHPDLGAYQLLAGNPPKPVLPEKFDMTLTEAGLAGAMVVVQECNL